MDILRFTTAGSVDDGKSTLIGRLLYDSKSILSDQLEAIQKSTKNNSNGEIDLSLLTDGLRAERQQGITIDVAYKYFSTLKRKFIIADTPGHLQYTRNMVTGASNSNLSVILIDARNGVTEQTKRHSIISSLLGIQTLIICINKMDLVGYSQDVFHEIVEEYKKFASKLDVQEIEFIPISALVGDNVVEKSAKMSWYEGKSLLHYLEEVKVKPNNDLNLSRFPVQWIIRPGGNNGYHDYRGYAGKIISGVFKKGDEVFVSPSGFNSTIESIEIFGKEVEKAFAPMSVVLHIADDVDISRGDVIVKKDNKPLVSQDIEAIVCWMEAKPLVKGNKYFLQHNSKLVKCIVKDIIYKIDVNTLDKLNGTDSINLNDICEVKIKTASPLSFDPYKKNRANGGFILIDESNNVTAGAGMIKG
jgi:sulfate adenylyltransferase subunit 1